VVATIVRNVILESAPVLGWIGILLMVVMLGFAIYWSWLQAQQTPSEPQDTLETVSEDESRGDGPSGE
jgi:hypothetical protein